LSTRVPFIDEIFVSHAAIGGEAPLLARDLTRYLWTTLLVGLVVCLAESGYAQGTPKGTAYLVGMKKSDRVGPKSAYPDGKLDAVFSLALDPKLVRRDVGRIRIRAVKGAAGAWSTNPKSPGTSFLGVASAKRPSVIINPAGGTLRINPRKDPELLLFVSDDGKFSDPNRQYDVQVTLRDGTSAVIPVKAQPEPSARAESPKPREGSHPVRMSAVLKGISRYDAVGASKTIKGDDRPDGLFVLTVEAKDKEITGIQIRNEGGQHAVWDTIPGSGNNAIGVAFVKDPSRLLNYRNGGVRIRVRGRVDLNLYVADNGSIKQGSTNYRITASFSDGSVSWCLARRASKKPEQPKPTKPEAPARVSFLGSWLGYVSTDAVGPYPEMKPDSKADAVFGLDIEISPARTITGIEIQSLTDPGRKWTTSAVSEGGWGLGVAYQGAPKILLNRSDGTVRIPVGSREQFYLYAADPGDLGISTQRFRMIVHLDDGSAFQQFVRRPVATTHTVVPGTKPTGPPRARGLMTCEFLGFIPDLVNTSTRPGKDGYLDGTFRLKLKVDNKQVSKIVIKGPDGTIRWSSHPKAPVMFLGVALYPKIYNLVNLKGQALSIPISGRKTIYLYAADNGLLSDPNSRLTVEVDFSDKTTLSAEVIK
jgi:hypothetical protein